MKEDWIAFLEKDINLNLPHHNSFPSLNIRPLQERFNKIHNSDEELKVATRNSRFTVITRVRFGIRRDGTFELVPRDDGFTIPNGHVVPWNCDECGDKVGFGKKCLKCDRTVWTKPEREDKI